MLPRSIGLLCTQEHKFEELEKLQNEQELHIMDMYNVVEKSTEKIEDGCKLAERVLDLGNSTHIVSLEKYISKQLMMLINNTPKLDVTVNIQFDSDVSQFTEAMAKNFGTFRKPLVPAVNAIENQSDDEELTNLQVSL